MDELFDVGPPVEIITQWAAHVCCRTSHRVYYTACWNDRTQLGPRYQPVMLVRPDVEEPADEQPDEQAAKPAL